ncbi:hypothetical protein ABPG75_009540 [Micractinium tetrahymenae]
MAHTTLLALVALFGTVLVSQHQGVAATSEACYGAVQAASDKQCSSLFAGGTCGADCDAVLESAATLCGSKNAFTDAITSAVNLSDEISNQDDMLLLCPTDFYAQFGTSAAAQCRPAAVLPLVLLAAALAQVLLLVLP